MTDADLLRRVRDRAALAELYDRHAPCLFSVARRILGEDAAATAAVEDLFLSLWDGSAVYDAHYGSPQSWLVRLIRENALTGQAQKVATPVDADETPTPRRLVEQAFYGGRGVDELARAHSLTNEQVRAMLCRGMSELRNQFAR
ncbi:MAG TPA: sigma factor [Thermoanaerobaculia bacterium]|jgi:DNA-directed RNA polymerase specialized sigma24 family protein|nr:sigma factor [Thermoanaerobaculia bacterium]